MLVRTSDVKYSVGGGDGSLAWLIRFHSSDAEHELVHFNFNRGWSGLVRRSNLDIVWPC